MQSIFRFFSRGKTHQKTFFQRGFSLLELLVVISIIVVLTSIGVVAYTNTQQKARDTKRIQDLNAISSAQEQYYFASNAYVSLGTGGTACTGTAVGGLLDPVPKDPRNVSPYQYRCDTLTGNTAYCVDAELESATGNCGGCDECDDGICPFVAGTTHYCVRNRQ